MVQVAGDVLLVAFDGLRLALAPVTYLLFLDGYAAFGRDPFGHLEVAAHDVEVLAPDLRSGHEVEIQLAVAEQTPLLDPAHEPAQLFGPVGRARGPVAPGCSSRCRWPP